MGKEQTVLITSSDKAINKMIKKGWFVRTITKGGETEDEYTQFCVLFERCHEPTVG